MIKLTPSHAPRLGNGRLNWKEMASSYAMVLPAIAFLCVFTLYPMIDLFHMSFYRGNANNPFKSFEGLDNYKWILFTQPDFLVSLKNTAYYTLAVVVLLISLALIFAVWMQKDRRINRIAQSVFFTPHLVATLSCAFIWQWLYNSESYGLLNSVLDIFGLGPVRFLDSSATAMNCVVAMNVWKGIGYYALIILSALKSIPNEIYEAARLDNSSTLKTFFRITLPMLSPQLFFLLITITIGSFKVFDSVRIMTNGGPGTSTQVVTMFIYNYAFVRNNTLGVASAAGVLLMIILMLITLVYFRALERKVHYQ